jgi:four helix bundle protein
MPTRFDQLDVYQTSIRYTGQTRPLVLRLRREDPVMADQLHRATLSIPLNLAEGAGEFSTGEKAKHYRYALRSTAETIAILDCAREISLMQTAEHARCRETALRVMAMLTRLVLSVNGRERERDRLRKRVREQTGNSSQ